MSFYLTRTTNNSIDSVLNRLKDLLHAHNYLIAADIDVQGALKERLDANLPPLRIIGTNTPSVGYKIFSTDPKLGTLLPFSIVLHALSDNEVEVTMVNPEWLFGGLDDPLIISTASEVKSVFQQILAAL